MIKYLDYCYGIIKEQIGEYYLSKIEVVFVPSSSKFVAGINPRIKEDKYIIKINANKFKRMGDYEIKKELSSILIHEIEHFKTFEYTKLDDFYDYEHLVSLLEYIFYLNTLDVSHIGINSPLGSILLKRLIKNNYNISTSELKSNLASRRSLENNSELNRFTLNAIEMLNDSMEITYIGNRPVSKLNLYISCACGYLKKHPKLLNEYKILKLILNDDFTLKNIEELFNSRNDMNKHVIDKIILELVNKNNIPNTTEFTNYLKELIRGYNDKVIYFYKNIDKGEIFIKNRSSLIDNFKYMMKKNERLHALCYSEELTNNTKSI